MVKKKVFYQLSAILRKIYEKLFKKSIFHKLGYQRIFLSKFKSDNRWETNRTLVRLEGDKMVLWNRAFLKQIKKWTLNRLYVLEPDNKS